ncbi:MAG: ABC transporter ATP-binding protein [Clostridia bacterium]|nr:ABC transporter ATP-binding protein [Clostridia bacterium]
MSKKNGAPMSLFKLVSRIAPLAFKGLGGRYALAMLSSFTLLTLEVVMTFATAQLFNSVEAAITSGSYVMSIVWLGVVLAVIVATPLLNSVVNLYMGDLMRRSSHGILLKLQDKASKLPTIRFEMPETLDALNKAENGAFVASALISILLLVVFGYIPGIIGMTAYLYSLKPILAIMPLVVFVPVITAQLVKVKFFADLESASAPMRRKVDYYERFAGHIEFFKETRLLGCFGFFRRLYSESVAALNKLTWKTHRKAGLAEMSIQLLTIAAYALMTYLLVVALQEGAIRVGEFAVVFTSISSMFDLIQEMVQQNLGQVMEERSLAANVITLLDAPEREGDAHADASDGIALRGVCFRYPGSERDCLHDVNLDIAPRETLAIVGLNGAGKSTLVKLITGIFTPTQGEVLFSGTPTSVIDPKSLFANTSAVFQDYGKYKMTLERNIRLGDTHSDAPIDEALRDGNVDVNGDSFPDGADTLLSKEFGGVDISGGQWQRVAIARGLYRQHELIILDEPTAAIDPIEESLVYRKFIEVARDKTAIIITHRLGSCRIADRIAVMNDGAIVQVGSHEELLADERGLYREMWDAQSGWLV